MGPAVIRVIHRILDPGHRLEPVETCLDRGGHGPEMDGDVLGLGEHLPLGVEYRCRAICPLLDVR